MEGTGLGVVSILFLWVVGRTGFEVVLIVFLCVSDVSYMSVMV